jgi:hypothetical protein
MLLSISEEVVVWLSHLTASKVTVCMYMAMDRCSQIHTFRTDAATGQLTGRHGGAGWTDQQDGLWNFLPSHLTNWVEVFLPFHLTNWAEVGSGELSGLGQSSEP